MSELEKIKYNCIKCNNCELSKTRTNVVFGVGNEHAKIMFIGEAPGENEDKTGIPFVGAAGQLFDKYLSAVDIDRDDVYIANILKCRPPKNRDPEKTEEDACICWLNEQIRAISPKLIVCLGRISAMRLISPEFKITRDHGKFYNIDGREICAVYHPSALLRDESKRGDMLYDMINIKTKYNDYKAEET